MINVPLKYTFTGKQKSVFLADLFGMRHTITVYQIVAVRSFGSIKEGTIGGWVARASRDERCREPNLDHRGDCWIADDAMAYGRSQVKNNALLCGNAKMYGHAVLTDSAIVRDNAVIKDRALVAHNATVGVQTIVGGVANIFGYSQLFCRANINQDRPHISDLVTVRDCARIEGNPCIRGRVEISDHVFINGTVRLNGNARFTGHSVVENSANIGDEVWVTGFAHICETAKMRGKSIASGRSIIGQGAYITDNAHINGAKIAREFVSGKSYRSK